MRIGSLSSTVAAVAFLASTVGASCGSSPTEPGAVNLSQDQPVIAKLVPSSGPVGTEVTLSGSGFRRRGNTVKFGRGFIKDIDSPDGVVMRFSIPEGLDLCAPNPTAPCPGAYPPVGAGDYVISVMTDSESATTLTFTVTRP